VLTDKSAGIITAKRTTGYFDCEAVEDKVGKRLTRAQWSAGNERTLRCSI